MPADALGVPKVALHVLATTGPFPLKSLGSPWGLTYTSGFPGGWLSTPMVRGWTVCLRSFGLLVKPVCQPVKWCNVQGILERLRNLLKIRLNLRAELNDEGKSDVW